MCRLAQIRARCGPTGEFHTVAPGYAHVVSAKRYSSPSCSFCRLSPTADQRSSAVLRLTVVPRFLQAGSHIASCEEFALDKKNGQRNARVSVTVIAGLGTAGPPVLPASLRTNPQC